jgi:hypothetical protein
MVARRDPRFQRLAKASRNKLEKRTCRQENPTAHSTRDRSTPRIQSKTWNYHGQSPSTTWRRKETEASFRKTSKGDGRIQVYSVHFPTDCRGKAGGKKISEPYRTRFLPSLFGWNEPLVRSDPNGSSSPIAPRINTITRLISELRPDTSGN